MREKLKTKALTMKNSHIHKSKKEKQKLTKSDYVTCGIVIITTIIAFRFILFTGYVGSGSMEPTIMTGDISVSYRLAYVNEKPERGDIIIFKRNGDTLGKRVVGIENDVVEFIDGYVYINGELLDESEYIDTDIETNSNKSFEVPEGCVFVLGDNRENSLDSRHWENPYVPETDIIAKLLFVIRI